MNNLLLELGQLCNFKIVCQVLQTVGQALSMLLKFSRHANFQDNARSCTRKIHELDYRVSFAVDRIISNLYLKKGK